MIYRRSRTDIIQVFRILKGFDNLDKNLFFTIDNSITRGHNLKLFKPRVNTKVRQNTFSQRVVNSWNKLSQETINATTINGFKSALEKEWRNHPKKHDPTG